MQAADLKSQKVENDSTPYQDFMKYLTQATYHSPGTKAESQVQQSSPPQTQALQTRAETIVQGTSISEQTAAELSRPVPAAESPCEPPTALLSILLQPHVKWQALYMDVDGRVPSGVLRSCLLCSIAANVPSQF